MQEERHIQCVACRAPVVVPQQHDRSASFYRCGSCGAINLQAPRPQHAGADTRAGRAHAQRAAASLAPLVVVVKGLLLAGYIVIVGFGTLLLLLQHKSTDAQQQKPAHMPGAASASMSHLDVQWVYRRDEHGHWAPQVQREPPEQPSSTAFPTTLTPGLGGTLHERLAAADTPGRVVQEVWHDVKTASKAQGVDFDLVDAGMLREVLKVACGKAVILMLCFFVSGWDGLAALFLLCIALAALTVGEPGDGWLVAVAVAYGACRRAAVAWCRRALQRGWVRISLR